LKVEIFYSDYKKIKEKKKKNNPVAGGGASSPPPACCAASAPLRHRRRRPATPVALGAELPSAAAEPLALGLQLPSAVAVLLALGVELPSAAARSPAAAPLAWGAEVPRRRHHVPLERSFHLDPSRGKKEVGKKKAAGQDPARSIERKGWGEEGGTGEGEAAGMVCSARGKGKEMRRGRRNTERDR